MLSCNNDAENDDCMPNIDMGLKLLTERTATIKWTETQGYASNYEYGISGFTLGNGIAGTTTEEMALLENLTANTEYDFYLQSICGESSTSIFSKYTFITIDCTGLIEENIITNGFGGNGDFSISWFPDVRESNIWEVAMIPVGETPSSANIILVTGVNYFGTAIPNINPDLDYTIYIRRKCDNTFGNWVEKVVTSDELQDFCQFEVIVEQSGNDTISIFADTGVQEIVIVEEGQDLESGLPLMGHTIYKMSIFNTSIRMKLTKIKK
jgi:hypothetical protein